MKFASEPPCPVSGRESSHAETIPKKRLGFTGCGKTPFGQAFWLGFVSGHDFSRAETIPKKRLGFTGCGKTPFWPGFLARFCIRA
jgi:hypothetical protein